MADLDIISFNELLKKYMNEVKIVEKTHPKQALNYWVNICKFILDFAKSPKCPRDLRPKLIRQAESILVKAKNMERGTIKSVFRAEKDAPLNKKNDPLEEEENEDEMMSQLMALDIPEESLSNEENISDTTETSSEDISPSIEPSSNVSSSPPSSSSSTSHLSSKDLSSIQKLEEDLRKMPSNMKEISPSPYDKDTIIPHKLDVDLEDYKKDTTTLDITSAPVDQSTGLPINMIKKGEKSEDLSPKIVGFDKDPFHSPKKDQSPENIADPFGPKDLPNDPLGGHNRVCFACGNKLRRGQIICSECHTENPLS